MWRVAVILVCVAAGLTGVCGCRLGLPPLAGPNLAEGCVVRLDGKGRGLFKRKIKQFSEVSILPNCRQALSSRVVSIRKIIRQLSAAITTDKSEYATVVWLVYEL